MSIQQTPIQPEVDLTNCDKEPIHIPGRIQPHGVLLVLEAVHMKIIQISNNTFEHLGRQPEDLLGTSLLDLIGQEQLKQIQSHFITQERKYTRPIYLTIPVYGEPKIFTSAMHRNIGGLFIVELEVPPTTAPVVWMDFYEMLRIITIELQQASNLHDLSRLIAFGVKELAKFDRVMVYQFDEDGHGEVIAEACEAHLESYLGLHYPASDIPQQARHLYLLNWLRLIADVNYQPVDIIPTLHPTTNIPVDLTFSFLRSVSPIHIEYLKNMGVGASMSISLIKNGQLWGLIACHHYESIQVPYHVRTACEFLGHIFSLQLSNRNDVEDYEYQIQVKSVQMRCVERLRTEDNFVEGLIKSSEDLLAMCGANGAALYFDDRIVLIGQTPQEQQVQDLITWLNARQTADIFYTHTLSKEYPPALDFKDAACGLISAMISSGQGHSILWFRQEVLQTVNWAGNPEKAIEFVDGEPVRLSPRKSFALWQQTVQNHALPWRPCEIEAVEELRDAIIDFILRTIEKLSSLNNELARSNSELDAFAYIASHDLKEPLRGIHNYATFLIEDYQHLLDEEGVAKLRTLVRLTQRMEDLINSLLHFSRVGRIDLSLTQTSLHDVLLRLLDMLQPSLQSMQIDVRIPRPLPTLNVDQVGVGEVLNNLITNAMKYNDKDKKWIEVGYLDQTPTIFYVRDNGIGIRDKHFETIFRIFKRLHTRDQYGGGTGSGLTIARKLVERHKGRLWVESTFGEGSTFYFTLESEKKL